MTSLEAAMRPRFSPADMAVVTYEMRSGLRLVMGSPVYSGAQCWLATSTAAKAAEIERVEAYLRIPVAERDREPDRQVEHDLFMLIVSRMAAELR
jgi:hypothetical protein